MLANKLGNQKQFILYLVLSEKAVDNGIMNEITIALNQIIFDFVNCLNSYYSQISTTIANYE